MSDNIFLPTAFGVCVFGLNKKASCLILKNGKLQINSQKIKKNNKKCSIFMICGLFFLFFGLFNFIYNLFENVNYYKKNNKLIGKVKQGLNVSGGNILFFCVGFLAIFIGYLFLGIIPIKLSFYLAPKNYNIFLKRLIIAFLKCFIIYVVFLSLKLLKTFKQFYKFNSAIIMQELKTNNVNFLNYFICSIFVNSFVISLIGVSSVFWYSIFVNTLISLFVFALNYEIIKFLQNGKFNWIFLPFVFLTYEKPSQKEIKCVNIVLSELEMAGTAGGKVETKENEMLFLESFAEAKQILEDANKYEKSDLDFIYAEVLNKNRAQVKLTKYISRANHKKVVAIAKRRASGEPISKIFEKACFYGMDFVVTKDVLSPRMETEILVENVIKNCTNSCRVLDIGTGSGAIAITVAKLCKCKTVAVDISEKALLIAKQNAKNIGVVVDFKLSDLFSAIKKQKFDIIVSNPPYIPSADIDKLDEEVKQFDPILALDGSESGLVFYEKIIEDAPHYLNKNGKIFFEVGINQAKDIKKLLQKNFKDIKIVKDYNKIERVVMATLNS